MSACRRRTSWASSTTGGGWPRSRSATSGCRCRRAACSGAAGPTALELLEAVRARGAVADPTMRQRLASVYIEHTLLELIRMRTLTGASEGGGPGPEASIRKLLGDEHGQHVMLLARDLIGAAALLTGRPTATAIAGSPNRPRRCPIGGRRPPRRSELALRLPVLPGADDRWRHRRRAAQHHRRTSPRSAPRRRRAAGPLVVGGPARLAVISSPRRCDGCQVPFAAHGDQHVCRHPAHARR